MLHALIKEAQKHYWEEGQTYLATLYPAMFSTAYYGLLRVGEITSGDHVIKACDVQLADNKDKVLIILRSSKTHSVADFPQSITITSTKIIREPTAANLCPYSLL